MVWLENGCGNTDRKGFLPELALTEEKGGEANSVVESQANDLVCCRARSQEMLWSFVGGRLTIFTALVLEDVLLEILHELHRE